MASTWTPLGPGTMKIGTIPKDFSCEVVGAGVTHTYSDVGTERTMLCGDVRGATSTRRDGFKASVENDLSAAGLYAFLQTNDLTDQELTFIPNTAGGAEWLGPVRVQLPSEIGATAYGEPIASDIEWAAASADGKLTFTPAA